MNLKRWYRNIRWLLNRPPTHITEGGEVFLCDYCSQKCNFNLDGLKFCNSCLRKALDKALKPKKEVKQ